MILKNFVSSSVPCGGEGWNLKVYSGDFQPVVSEYMEFCEIFFACFMEGS